MPSGSSGSRLSRRLSWLLRHGAHEAGLAMDPAGWAGVDEVLRAAGIDRSQLERAVAENDKGRLQFDGGRVRACQGHSLAGTPVTLDALEASWALYPDDGDVWHGTSIAALRSIGRTGIEPGRRSHVHLAPTADSHVGKRRQVELLLRISPARLRASHLPLYEAPNGVVLVRRVPAACIVGAEPHTAPPEAVTLACQTAGLPATPA